MKTSAFCIFAFSTAIAAFLSGCQFLGKVSLQPKGQQGPGQQTPAATAPGQTQPPPAAQPAGAPLSGYWKVAFQVGNQTMKANMRLEQNGNAFAGEGTDDPSGRAFTVTDGQINGNQVSFYKQYEGADPNTAPPVAYSGTFEVVNDGDLQGPYMSGSYQTAVQGRTIEGQWEAQMAEPLAQQGQPPPGPAQQQPPPAQPAQAEGKAPHLSGKWTVGYEYNFKTIKSTMFLEQDGGNITGHGVDLNTKEKFDIPKGWYHFPRLTIIRKYTKGKGAAQDRTMTFKAEVQVVHDADYQGPYLHGKTQGGGEWEAQLVR